MSTASSSSLHAVGATPRSDRRAPSRERVRQAMEHVRLGRRQGSVASTVAGTFASSTAVRPPLSPKQEQKSEAKSSKDITNDSQFGGKRLSVPSLDDSRTSDEENKSISAGTEQSSNPTSRGRNIVDGLVEDDHVSLDTRTLENVAHFIEQVYQQSTQKQSPGGGKKVSSFRGCDVDLDSATRKNVSKIITALTNEGHQDLADVLGEIVLSFSADDECSIGPEDVKAIGSFIETIKSREEGATVRSLAEDAYKKQEEPIVTTVSDESLDAGDVDPVTLAALGDYIDTVTSEHAVLNGATVDKVLGGRGSVGAEVIVESLSSDSFDPQVEPPPRALGKDDVEILKTISSESDQEVEMSAKALAAIGDYIDIVAAEKSGSGSSASLGDAKETKAQGGVRATGSDDGLIESMSSESFTAVDANEALLNALGNYIDIVAAKSEKSSSAKNRADREEQKELAEEKALRSVVSAMALSRTLSNASEDIDSGTLAVIQAYLDIFSAEGQISLRDEDDTDAVSVRDEAIKELRHFVDTLEKKGPGHSDLAPAVDSRPAQTLIPYQLMPASSRKPQDPPAYSDKDESKMDPPLQTTLSEVELRGVVNGSPEENPRRSLLVNGALDRKDPEVSKPLFHDATGEPVDKPRVLASSVATGSIENAVALAREPDGDLAGPPTTAPLVESSSAQVEVDRDSNQVEVDRDSNRPSNISEEEKKEEEWTSGSEPGASEAPIDAEDSPEYIHVDRDLASHTTMRQLACTLLEKEDPSSDELVNVSRFVRVSFPFIETQGPNPPAVSEILAESKKIDISFEAACKFLDMARTLTRKKTRQLKRNAAKDEPVGDVTTTPTVSEAEKIVEFVTRMVELQIDLEDEGSGTPSRRVLEGNDATTGGMADDCVKSERFGGEGDDALRSKQNSDTTSSDSERMPQHVTAERSSDTSSGVVESNNESDDDASSYSEEEGRATIYQDGANEEAVEVDLHAGFIRKELAPSNDGERPWWEIAARLGVDVIPNDRSFKSRLHDDSISGAHSGDLVSQPSMRTADSESLREADNEQIRESAEEGGLDEELENFWTGRAGVRERRLRFPKKSLNGYKRGLAMSFSDSVTTHTGTSGSLLSAAMAAKCAETEMESWARRNAMASGKYKKKWLSSRTDKDLVSKNPSAINAVDAAASLREFGFRMRTRQDLPPTTQWKVPYITRIRAHMGFLDVHVHSLYEAVAVNARSHPLDMVPWERRSVKQRFLHEQSVGFRRNWFGVLKQKLRNWRVPQPVCKPKSMEMPVWAGEWHDEWYLRPDAVPLPSSISDSPNSRVQELQRHYKQYRPFDDDEEEDEEDDNWGVAPECGKIKNVKQRIGERISRLTPEVTSSLRRSRWRKKHFPRGTFPY